MKFQLLTTSIAAVLGAASVASQEASSSRRNGRVLKGVAFPQQIAGAIEVYKESSEGGDTKSSGGDKDGKGGNSDDNERKEDGKSSDKKKTSDDEKDSDDKSSKDNKSSKDDKSSRDGKSPSSSSSSTDTSSRTSSDRKRKKRRENLADRYEDLCEPDNDRDRSDNNFCEDIWKSICDPEINNPPEDDFCEWLGFPDEEEDHRKRDFASVGTFTQKVLKGVNFPQQIAGSVEVMKGGEGGGGGKGGGGGGGDRKGGGGGGKGDRSDSSGDRKGGKGDKDDRSSDDNKSSKSKGRDNSSSSTDKSSKSKSKRNDSSSSSSRTSSSSSSSFDFDRKRRRSELDDRLEDVCDPRNDRSRRTVDRTMCDEVWVRVCRPEVRERQDDEFCDFIGFDRDVYELDSYDEEGDSYDEEGDSYDEVNFPQRDDDYYANEGDSYDEDYDGDYYEDKGRKNLRGQ